MVRNKRTLKADIITALSDHGPMTVRGIAETSGMTVREAISNVRSLKMDGLVRIVIRDSKKGSTWGLT